MGKNLRSKMKDIDLEEIYFEDFSYRRLRTAWEGFAEGSSSSTLLWILIPAM